MKNWIFYTATLGFTSYWASNLILWFPWSYSSTLGITLMLTVTPILWAYATYLSLCTYPKTTLLNGVISIAIIYLAIAVVFDYIFFVHIRNAMEELYQPTTFYGYGFLLFWPLMIAVFLKKRLKKRKKQINKSEILKVTLVGFSCLGLLILIIVLDISI